MNWKAVSFDWNQVRAFLVTAEEGSLSAAARALGLTQPTLGRQVAALEESLGVTLFTRAGKALILTPTGHELLSHVRAMGEAARQVSLAASGQSKAIAGPVSLTASDVVSAVILPPILRDLREIAPLVEVTVVATNDLRDISRREADIAVRHARPTQPDLIARKLPDSLWRLYAAPAYLDRIGRPRTATDLARADFIGFDESDRLVLALNGLGLPVTRDQFRLLTANGLVAWEMVRQGLGIGAMMAEVAVRTPGVEPVLPSLPGLPISTWLTTHRELHTSPRIRLVFDLLAARLGEILGAGEDVQSVAS